MYWTAIVTVDTDVNRDWCECRDKCRVELRELRLSLKSIESQQKTLMSNIDDDIYMAVKDVYDKVLVPTAVFLVLTLSIYYSALVSTTHWKYMNI